MSSYYRTIDGNRYDADLLELAEGMMEGRGDGRLSEADVEQLWEAAFDGRGMTAVEMATLAYIRANENPTRPAKQWLDEHGVGTKAEDNCLTEAGNIAGEFGLEEMMLMRFYPEEITAQENLENNTVKFPDAFRSGLETLFDPEHKVDAPYYLIKFAEELEPGLKLETEEQTVAKLKEYLNSGMIWLQPHGVEPNPNLNLDFYPAENGEKTDDNWIFNLTMDELSDHLYWMVVPRNGDKPFVYGFN